MVNSDAFTRAEACKELRCDAGRPGFTDWGWQPLQSHQYLLEPKFTQL